MWTGDLTLIGALLLGIASSLHCAAMCGGVCSRAIAMLDPHEGRRRWERIGLIQVGRLAVYGVIGVVAGASGAWILPAGTSSSFVVLHWMTALSLIWVGFVTAGLAPRFAAIDGAMSAAASRAHHVLRPLLGRRYGAPVCLGAIWGMSACPMVYGAAFLAALTGSANSGAAFMLAFGFGTLPAVLSAGLLLHRLQSLGGPRVAQFAAGLTIALAGFASIYFPPSELIKLCLN